MADELELEKKISLVIKTAKEKHKIEIGADASVKEVMFKIKHFD